MSLTQTSDFVRTLSWELIELLLVLNLGVTMANAVQRSLEQLAITNSESTTVRDHIVGIAELRETFSFVEKPHNLN